MKYLILFTIVQKGLPTSITETFDSKKDAILYAKHSKATALELGLHIKELKVYEISEDVEFEDRI